MTKIRIYRVSEDGKRLTVLWSVPYFSEDTLTEGIALFNAYRTSANARHNGMYYRLEIGNDSTLRKDF